MSVPTIPDEFMHWKPSRHNANFVVTRGTIGCRYDNLWCHQWWLSWHHDANFVVTAPTVANNDKVGIMITLSFQCLATYHGSHVTKTGSLCTNK